MGGWGVTYESSSEESVRARANESFCCILEFSVEFDTPGRVVVFSVEFNTAAD